ncbi:5-formyltetrahydrofolate cyclo-ligase [Acinetobacter sp. WZC-1]|uniref:5-formyltetrahydrofolate cyclo-ligase n=1 Tax=Acinetobacter sp. WZC-1 TaxID=3459034 RepID=UPI00403DBFA2
MSHLSRLRAQLQHQRRQLSIYQQQVTQTHVTHHLLRFSRFQSAQRVGLYLHAFGEVSTHRLIETCYQHHKEVYLPMINTMNQQLVWVKVSQHQYRNRRFSHHSLGMQEPMASRGQHVSILDLLIMPLLACDHWGTRIGMGGGFYDRTLASAKHRPFRLGLAHQFQYMQTDLPRSCWDQSLDALLTPDHFYRFKR